MIEKPELFGLLTDLPPNLDVDEAKKWLVERGVSDKLIQKIGGIPRQNIENFINSTFAGFKLKDPFLEIGCGRRSYRPEALRIYGDILYVATDHYLHTEQGCISERLPNLINDAHKLPFRENSFHTVICTELLEHVDEDEQVIKEIGRVLSPGGYLIVSVPGQDIPWHSKSTFQSDKRRYTLTSLNNLINIRNFKNIRINELTFMGKKINLFLVAEKK